MSIAVAVLVVMATVAPVSVSTMSPAVRLSADSTALILGGTTVPTPDNVYIETVRNHFIAPTHPDQINYVAVTTPEEFWPITGLIRLVWLALGPQSVWGPGGPGWPDEPWWKLSGLFDLTIDQSIQAGVADLEQAMAEHGNDHLVIYGYSQGAIIANREKRKLAEQYPAGTQAPDIGFVLSGDLNVPNGGLLARFPGLYIPILDLKFNGPEPTNTQFHTTVITRQYDGLADFPLYPLNLVADLNALLGVVYVHPYDLDVSLPADPTKSPAYQGTHGDASYYFFPTEDLPLFAPLRSLGVPESLIDVVEPVFKVIVDLGYDRSIKPWQPTPVRLIPRLKPATVAADLVNAVGEGINNAAVLFGAPAPLSIPTPAVTADQDAATEQNFSGPRTTLKTVSHNVGDGVSRVLTAVGSQLPEPFAVSQNDLQASQRKVVREPAATNDRIIGAVKSVIGNGRTIVRSAGRDNGSQTATAGPAHKTPGQDAVKQARSDIKRAVGNVSDSIKHAVDGVKDHDSDGDSGEGAAP